MDRGEWLILDCGVRISVRNHFLYILRGDVSKLVPKHQYATTVRRGCDEKHMTTLVKDEPWIYLSKESKGVFTKRIYTYILTGPYDCA